MERTAFISLAIAGLLSVASCGGNDTTSFGESTSASGAGASGAGATGATGGSGATGGASDGGGGAGTAGAGVGGGAGGGGKECTAGVGDCKSKIMDLRMKLAAAKACSPQAMNTCQDVVDGLCCDQVVADANSPETKCYLETLAEVAVSGCNDCTPEPCPQPQKQCVSADGQSFCQ